MPTPTSTEAHVEETIIDTLCSRLATAGWTPVCTDTGDWDAPGSQYVSTPTVADVTREFLSVGQCTVTFQNAAGERQGVLLVGGNGADVIADHDFKEGDANGFSAAMDAIYDHITETYG
jgi:hypothetical protein